MRYSCSLIPTQLNLKKIFNIDSEVRFIGLLLCWLQLMDGVLTYVGVGKLGIYAEGNLMLRELMLQHGCLEALLLVKLPSLMLIPFLCYHASNITWVKKGLLFTVHLYLFIAIIPWVSALVSS
jgi:hypothetical protein